MTGLPMGETMVVVAALTLAIALAAASTGVVWTFERRLSRLPAATRLDDLDVRGAAKDTEIIEKTEELRRLDARIQDRDRLAAEVGALVERTEALRAELASLDPARDQIEAVKRQAAEAAEAYAAGKDALDHFRLERDQAEAALREAEDRLRRLEQQAGVAEERTRAATAQSEEARAGLQGLENERARLADEVAELKAGRTSLLDALDQAAALAARREAAQREIVDLENRLAADGTQSAEARVALAILLDQLDATKRDLKSATDTLSSAREEAAALAARRAAADQTLADLKAEIERHRAAPPGPAGTAADEAAALGNLLHAPACFEPQWSDTRPVQDESDALRRLETDLRDRGLHYDVRTVRAFHTALKINDAAQLAVLAGVSGTGKSLLPRCYAEAMGMRFLQVPVEPRWDSPQDLLGFYNYVEKGFRATDLSRALARMDRYDTSNLGMHGNRDEVLLVLLDEMNLARVEYYFSEFLSRLEMRPSFGEAGDANRRQVACLPIDIPGRKPVRLFPGHNVLFVGTMNDDESTQSLSDKVLDRSNVLQFPAPLHFDTVRRDEPSASESGQRLDFGAWRSWVRRPDALADTDRNTVAHTIATLGNIMRELGRPFGHRLSDAILAYAANYPRGSGVEMPLADQVEMRILPKLRGLTIDGHRPQFTMLEDLIGKELGDSLLADNLKQAVEQQGSGIGQFSWRGFSRDAGRTP